MQLLKTKKKKTWHSVCQGDYEYQSKDTYYIVELTESEYRAVLNTVVLDNNGVKLINDILDNPPKPNIALDKLMKDNTLKTDASPCIVKYINGQPDVSDSVDAGPCTIQVDKNGNPIIKTVSNTGEIK